MSKFRFYNANPFNLRQENDCVCRAISTALGIDYWAVDHLLTDYAKRHKCDKLCVCCYHYLLEDRFNLNCYYCHNGETVGDILNEYMDGIVIIRIEGHLTCAVFGELQDIWDCRRQKVDCFWVV